MDRQAFQERFGLFGDSPALRRVIDRARQVADVDITVLVEGESGVGKELIATAVHALGPRRHKRLVVVNCGAIPEGLIESELFGAEKGAYTGAVERRTGYFEEADGGTLFLDEIGEMPLPAQVRLLRVLETGRFTRVGSSREQQTDVRVIAATNKDLGAEVRAGRFREDLYYRLSAVVLRVPPLRERREDVLPLFVHYLRRFAEQYDAPRPRLDASARELLRRYNWPGNVRELRNVAEQSVVLLRGDDLTADALRPHLRGVSAAAGLTVASREAPGGPERREQELIYRALLDLRVEMREIKAFLHRLAAGIAGQADALPALPEAHADHASEPVPTPTFAEASFAGALARDLAEPERFERDEAAYSYDDVRDVEVRDVEVEDLDDAQGALVDEEAEFEEAEATETSSGLDDLLAQDRPLPSIEEAERALIREALRRSEGSRRDTARVLGISERTLYRKIKAMEAEGIDV